MTQEAVAGSAELAGLAGLEAVPRGGGADLRPVVLADPGAGGAWGAVAARLLERTCWAQPALWCVEVALARLWESWGVVPQAVVGHSLGELVAASLAGAFDLRSAARLVVARGLLMQAQPAGAMATVLAGAQEAGALLAAPELSGLSVAAWNGPGECVVSGPAGQVAEFGRAAARLGWGVIPVPGGHGFHSALMDGAVTAFRDFAARELAAGGGAAAAGELRVPFTSNVTGGWITAAQVRDPGYWAGHIRSGVRFADNVATVLDGQPGTVLLEIGPGRALTSLGRRILAASPGGAGHTVLASLPHRADDRSAADTVRSALAALWTRGLNPSWDDYYRHHPRQRVPLPTYPFTPTRHWLPAPTSPEATELPAPPADGLHPLLDETVLDGADESVYRTRFAISRQWVLSEHKLLGEAIVPGTTYLEMAAAAAERRFGRPATKLADVSFYIPLLVADGDEAQVHITIRDAGDDRAVFSVASRTAGEGARDSWVMHARGTVSVAPLLPAEPADPAALRAQCSRGTVDTAAMQAEHQVMEFGPRWTDSLRRVHVGVRSALGELALPPEHADSGQFRLHPALLDLATGFGALAVPGADDDLAGPGDERDFFLPVGYGEIEIHRPLPAHGLSLITLRPDHDAHAPIRVADVFVCDEQGQPTVVIRGFTARRVTDPRLMVTRLRPHQRHHRVCWVPAPARPPAAPASSPAGPMLIVGASSDRITALAGKLREAGASLQTVLIDDAAFGVSDAGDIGNAGGPAPGRIAPTAAVLADLVARSGARELIFVAADAAEDRSPQRLRADLDRGVHALFHLLKAAVLAGGLERLTVVAPTVRPVSGTEKALAPQHAALFGLAKVFALEQDGCSVLCVDDDGDAASICAELRGARTTSMVALRDGARLVQLLAPTGPSDTAHASDAAGTGSAEPPASARNYLITGGLGGLGLAVAEHLSASRPGVRIALVGRSAAPSRADWTALAAADRDRDVDKRHRQARVLSAMRKHGTDVRTFAADVTDEKAMRAIVAELTAQWGTLDCVVHAAGVAGDGFLFRKDASTFADTMAPKVLGAAVLDQVTDGDVPPTIITFGSTVTVFGAAGQGDYTAANDYLAAFADERSARGRPTATLAWSDWLEVGMAVDNAVAEHKGFFRSLTPAEALASFDDLADAREPNTIIGEVNSARLGTLSADDLDAEFRHAPVLLGEPIRVLLAQPGRAARATPGTARASKDAAETHVVLLGREDGEYTQSERALAGMWASELGLDRLDITASSFTLGGDSLTALRMVQRIEKVMNIGVSIVDLFQYETVAELAAYLDGQYSGGGGA